MLLALAARSLRPMLVGEDARLGLADLPRYAYEQLGLHGLMLSADMLAGVSRDGLSRLRDAADRARCSCLVLMEESPQKLAVADASAGLERIGRVMAAAGVLGCNSAAIAIEAPDSDAALELVADRLKGLMGEAERKEINLLILPGTGLTGSVDRLTELLKRVGGFRVGTMPDFGALASADSEAMTSALRKLTPYASAVLGTTLGFEPVSGEADDDRATVRHAGYDVLAAVEAVAAVGYDGAVGLDYAGPGDVRLGLIRSRVAFGNAMAGKGGPFLLYDEAEEDEGLDAAAAALLDAIFEDDGDDEPADEAASSDADPAPPVAVPSVDQSDGQSDGQDDDRTEAEQAAEPSRSASGVGSSGGGKKAGAKKMSKAAATSKKTTSKKTGSKKTGGKKAGKKTGKTTAKKTAKTTGKKAGKKTTTKAKGAAGTEAARAREDEQAAGAGRGAQGRSEDAG